jgi:hypothetical protein
MEIDHLEDLNIDNVNVKIILNEQDGCVPIYLAQDKDQWPAVVYLEINFQFV